VTVPLEPAAGRTGFSSGAEFGHNDGCGGLAVIIACPNCSTGYLLPEHLVGPGGARVRCPRCQHLFAVDVDGLPRLPAAPVLGTTPPESHVETAPEVVATPAAGGEPAAAGALAVARAVLEQLAVHEGEASDRARAELRFFAEFGPALMVAYETYCRRAGEDADPGTFRRALRERWGLELVPLEPREG
jgi:predicted Zn finger-like uncharacterized protein